MLSIITLSDIYIVQVISGQKRENDIWLETDG